MREVLLNGCPCCNDCCDNPDVQDTPEYECGYDGCEGSEDCPECFALIYLVTCMNCGDSCICNS